MALHRLAGECQDDVTCPGIWADSQVPGEVIVVGHDVDPSPVPLGPGERAVRLSRQLIVCAGQEA